METEPLQRIDSFPYRHRLSDVMSSPAVTGPADLPVDHAARIMDRQKVSSLLVLEPTPAETPAPPVGIVTERDILRAVARDGRQALDRPIAAYMTSPVEAMPADAMVYRALGRMDRLGIRHLAVVDASGRAVGVITARGLLKQRAGTALSIGDELAEVTDAAAMARVRARLPELAAGLLTEEVTPLDVAAVISEVTRAMTAGAARLAEAEMVAAGRGQAPAGWCLLILGSGGRGESLLAPDQDNALIHDGAPADDPWFGEFGQRLNRLLDDAGVPYCRGGVMVAKPGWRANLAGWIARVDGWIAHPRPENLLNVDIFFDFQPVEGDRRLAEALRTEALGRAARSFDFLKLLTAELDRYRAPLGLLGGFRAPQGRLDLKIGGLFPIVAGARALALRNGIAQTSTPARLAALCAGGHLPEEDRSSLVVAQQLLTGLLLREQIADLGAGREPSSRIDIRQLDRRVRQILRDTLRRLDDVPTMVRDNLIG